MAYVGSPAFTLAFAMVYDNNVNADQLQTTVHKLSGSQQQTLMRSSK